jgi:nucleoside-diphosphate-sugar epimerase
MSDPAILVTGAAGFLGSAVTIDLARDHTVVAIDRRAPSGALVHAAPTVIWQQVDITHRRALMRALEAANARLGSIDFVVHLAAFYHFGSDWRPEYQLTNIDGTANVLQLARDGEVRRFVFASSVAAMAPSPQGQALTERSPTAHFLPYAKSKSIGEQMVRDSSDRLPAAVLRIAGVFTDWCELPPLYSLIKVWTGPAPLSRAVVGSGTTGIPYLHRHDLVRAVRACVARHQLLDRYEVLLASQTGTTSHNELFDLVHRQPPHQRPVRPIHLPALAARLLVGLRCAWGSALRNMPYERPWMLKYVDRPWVVDTSYTRRKLGWDCTAGMGIADRLPQILQRVKVHRAEWHRRNRLRNEGQYAYAAEESTDPPDPPDQPGRPSTGSSSG